MTPALDHAVGKARNELFDRLVPGEHVKAEKNIDFVAKPVMVVGSSGSGKTHLMVTAGQPALVLHIVGLEDPPVLEASLGDNADREHRDASVFKDFERAVSGASDELWERCFNAKGITGIPRRDFGECAPQQCVRVVIDEAGGQRRLIRSVLCQHRELVDKAQEILKCTNVELVIGGTGSEDPSEPLGSQGISYEVIIADDESKPVIEPAMSEIERIVFEGAASAVPADGTRLSQVDQIKASVAWAIVEALATNARGAAMILLWLRGNWATYERFLAACRHRQPPDARRYAQVPDADLRFMELLKHGGQQPSAELTTTRLQVLAADVSRAMRLVNAMRALTSASAARQLADALCVDVWGFDGFENRLKERELTGVFGILVDRAVMVQRPASGDNYAAKLAEAYALVRKRPSPPEKVREVYVLKPARDGHVAVVPDDGRGRYFVPPAYAAMYAALLQATGARAEGHAEFLERVAAKAVAVASALTPQLAGGAPAAVSTTLAAMHKFIPKTSSLPAFEAGERLFRGRLMTEALVHDAGFVAGDDNDPAPVPGAVSLGAALRSVPWAQLPGPRNEDEQVRSAKEAVQEAFDHARVAFMPHVRCGKPGAAAGNVLVNAPRSPYADVVSGIFGPQGALAEVINVQAKCYTSSAVPSEAIEHAARTVGVHGEDLWPVGQESDLAEKYRRNAHGAMVARLHYVQHSGEKELPAGDGTDWANWLETSALPPPCAVHNILLCAVSPGEAEKMRTAAASSGNALEQWFLPIDQHGRVVDEAGKPKRALDRSRPFYPLFVRRVAALEGVAPD